MNEKEVRVYSLEEKQQIALEALQKATGKSPESFNLDTPLKELFPEAEISDNDQELAGDPAMLEFLINLEMKVYEGSFKLDPDHFFEPNLNLRHFVNLLQEAEESDKGSTFDEYQDLTPNEEEELDESSEEQDSDSEEEDSEDEDSDSEEEE